MRLRDCRENSERGMIQHTNTKSVGEDFHKVNFISFYKDIIDVAEYKRSPDNFKKTLDSVDLSLRKSLKSLEGVKRNLVITGGTGLDKFCFLSLFSRLPLLASHRYMNAMNLNDIWFKNDDWHNQRKEDDEIFMSEQDIREDVLCVFVDKDMFLNDAVSQILNTVVVSRSERMNKRYEKLLTWVYFRGSQGDFKDRMSKVSSLFSSDDGIYGVVDLGVSRTTSNSKTRTVSGGTTLNDIY